MLISEIEAKLKELREKHGDLPCYGYHQTWGLAKVYPIERFSTDIDKEYIAFNLHPLPWNFKD